ncbi:MAG: hypothetical protein ACLPG5_12610, partial [Acidocella sp.]
QAAADGHPVPLSWQSLIMKGTAGVQDAEFVLMHPKLDQSSLQPGGKATAALRQIAASLPDVKAGRATVDYTGQIPLSDEQFASLTQGMLLGGVISVMLIALWLYLALRSWRLIVPILLTHTRSLPAALPSWRCGRSPPACRTSRRGAPRWITPGRSRFPMSNSPH